MRWPFPIELTALPLPPHCIPVPPATIGTRALKAGDVFHWGDDADHHVFLGSSAGGFTFGTLSQTSGAILSRDVSPYKPGDTVKLLGTYQRGQ